MYALVHIIKNMVSIDMITMITNDKYDKYVHTTFSMNMITIDIIMYFRYE